MVEPASAGPAVITTPKAIQFIRLNEFRESWMPTLKTGGFRQFQLFDLVQDITQRDEVSRSASPMYSSG